MSDALAGVERTEVVAHGSDEHRAYESNLGWHLLYITGGLHGPVEYVFGWGNPYGHGGPQ